MTVIPEPPAATRAVPLAHLVTGGRWRTEAMRSLPQPLLLWFTAGQGRITVAGVTRGYGVHNAVFIPAGTMHGFEMSRQVRGTALFIARDLALPLPEAPQHLRVRETRPQQELTALLDAVQREIANDDPAAGRALHHQLGLLSVWIARRIAAEADGSDPSRPDGARRLAARYTVLVERDLTMGRDVADYAAALGVTPTHLTRACRAACGRTAHELLQDRLLFEARCLLSDTTLPVKDIAGRLGFGSAAYFTRAFHYQTGQTPSAFRRESGGTMRHQRP